MFSDMLKEHAASIFRVEEEANQASSFKLHEEENLLCNLFGLWVLA
jgi:hypothetical protein